ncbi:MAG: heavy-metal-associated domain-containing protein [Leptospiraceae bacterium]|nr:heavy-metal-associated domain-containing protein [Leptospiraceae bacterium]
MKSIVLNVEGMSCQHCVKSVREALDALGVASTVNLEQKTVSAEFDETQVSVGDISAAIEDQGYDVVGTTV